MAGIAHEVEKMLKKNKGSGDANGFGFGFGFGFGSPSCGDSSVKKKAADKASEGSEKDDHREAGVHLNALMEDLFGLKLRSEGEGEKSAVKNITTSSRGRGGVSIKENDEAKTVKLEIPGLGKEHVKVSVVNNALLIEGDAVPDENEDGKKKNNNNKWRMYLPEEVYKSEETKAVMKNGVLTVVVPKKKVDERKDAIHVVVEG